VVVAARDQLSLLVYLLVYLLLTLTYRTDLLLLFGVKLVRAYDT